MAVVIPDSFHKFYEAFWGDRWPSLLASLSQADQVARRNGFASLGTETAAPLWRPEFTDLYQLDSNSVGLRGEEGLLVHYVMDPASVFVARLLGVQPGERILDLCAAPGGKSLVLIEALFAAREGALEEPGEIILNEPSMNRRERLKKVIQQYVPRSVRDHIHLAGKDGGKFALTHPNSFDRILVDAPCSGEAHMLENAAAMAEFSEKRSKGLAQRQYALLTGAFEALRPGGSLVYSTCSVSKWENEGVVERFLKKRQGRVDLEVLTAPEFAGENVDGLLYFLPDRGRMGPLFAARFRKREL